MLTFNNLEEMQPYYNARLGAYVFNDDINIKFDLSIKSDIKAHDISAININAYNIDAIDINACDIKAHNIIATSIKADDIVATNIDASDISFYACCVTYESLVCNTIEGRRKNSYYKCLDSEVVIRNE